MEEDNRKVITIDVRNRSKKELKDIIKKLREQMRKKNEEKIRS